MIQTLFEKNELKNEKITQSCFSIFTVCKKPNRYYNI
jgi:hypothetical protein